MDPVTTRLPVFDVQLLEPEPAPTPPPAPEAAQEPRGRLFNPGVWVCVAGGVYVAQIAVLIGWAVAQ